MTDQLELGAQGVESDLAAARSLLEAVAAHIESTPFDRRAEAVSAWCVGQQLIHVCLVAQSIATVAKRLMRSGGADEESTVRTREILAGAVFPRGAPAPGGMTRDECPSLDELQSALAKARRGWDALADKQADIEAAAGTMPHPLLGALDAAEWVRFAAIHGMHHLRIVEDILAA